MLARSGARAKVGLAVIPFFLLWLQACDRASPPPAAQPPVESPASPGSSGATALSSDEDDRAAPRIDLTAAAKAPAFQAAIAEFAEQTGIAGEAIDRFPGGVSFKVSHAETERRLDRWNGEYLERGAYVFRYDNGFGLNNGPDVVVMLPTTDKYVVLRAAGTDGVNYDIDNDAIVSWLQDMEKTHPFVLTGAGMDFLEGRFVEPPNDTQVLAEKMYKFCPDIVDQGVGDIAALASVLRKGKLFFWWD